MDNGSLSSKKRAITDSELASITGEFEAIRGVFTRKGESNSAFVPVYLSDAVLVASALEELRDRREACWTTQEASDVQLKGFKQLALNVISVEEHCSNLGRFPSGCGECLYCQAIGLLSSGVRPEKMTEVHLEFYPCSKHQGTQQWPRQRSGTKTHCPVCFTDTSAESGSEDPT